MRLLLAAAAALLSLTAFADESAADISKKSREKGALNLVGLTAELKLVTTTAEGKVKEQQLTSSSRTINGKSHALARFSAPAGVAGVAVLTVVAHTPGSHAKKGWEEFTDRVITCLSEEIETTGPGQVRALIAIACNPVLSMPGGARNPPPKPPWAS